MNLRQLHSLCGVLPNRPDVHPGAFQWLDGRVFVNDVDSTGLPICEPLEVREQRLVGQRTVRFMCAGECLKEVTMNRFLELTGA